MTLSILICHLYERDKQLARLLDRLLPQIGITEPVRLTFGAESSAMHQFRNKECEIIILSDNRQQTIGAKRNKLLAMASGDFVAFADDDDLLDVHYCRKIICAIKTPPVAEPVVQKYNLNIVSAINGPYDVTPASTIFGHIDAPLKTSLNLRLQVDVIGIEGVLRYKDKDGNDHAEPFFHSIKYDKWYSKDSKHYRTCNHLNPVRRELALKVGFPDIMSGEDHNYSTRLAPLLQVEHYLEGGPVYEYLK